MIRVDSSMVSQACGKLQVDGIDYKNGKRSVKHSIAFDGILPSEALLFTEPKYTNEDTALPEVVTSHVKQDNNHQNIYLIDRGLQSARNYKKNVGVNRAEGTYKRFLTSLGHLKRFMRKKYNIADIPFLAITPSFVADYVLPAYRPSPRFCNDTKYNRPLA